MRCLIDVEGVTNPAFVLRQSRIQGIRKKTYMSTGAKNPSAPNNGDIILNSKLSSPAANPPRAANGRRRTFRVALTSPSSVAGLLSLGHGQTTNGGASHRDTARPVADGRHAGGWRRCLAPPSCAASPDSASRWPRCRALIDAQSIVVVPCTLILGRPRRHPGSPQASPSRPLALGLDPRRGLAFGKSHRDLGAGDTARQCHACGHRHRADGSRRGALAPAAPLQFAAHGTRSRNRDRIGRAEREHSSGGPASHSLFLELG